MKKNRFQVIEYSSFYAVRDTISGQEHPISDDVDSVFTPNGKALSPGTEYFRRKWQRILNESPDDVCEAYGFPNE